MNVPIEAVRKQNLSRLLTRYQRQQALADAVGMSVQYLNQLFVGKRNLGEKLARKIEMKLGLERGWLDVPEGEETAPSEVVATLLNNMTPDQVKLLLQYQRLSPAHQAMLQETAASYAAIEQIQPRHTESARSETQNLD
jgi:hypothetical protein